MNDPEPQESVAQALNLPQITSEALLVGGVVLLVGLGVAFVVRLLVRTLLRWRGRGTSAVRVFGRIAGWLVALLAVGVAFTVVFPSIRPVDLIGGIGVVSIAAGIAFQTVLGNMFAGIVILARDRFNVGDQVHVGEVRGTVEEIGLSSTVVRAFDGQQVLIPNSTVHSEMVTVQTGYERVRTTVTLDVDLVADHEQARVVAVEAMLAVPQVLPDPAPQALATEVTNGAVTTEMRFWSGARQLETREARDAVIRSVLRAFTAEGVLLASDVITVEAGVTLDETVRRAGQVRPPEDPSADTA